MVVSHIIGGLGNQMFQYALGRSLAMALDTELRLDVSDFSGYALYQGFELGRVFDASFQIASEGEVQKVLGWRSNRLCRRVLKRRHFSALRNKQFVVEPGFQFWPGAASIGDDCYLVGYWQSEKYFSDIKDIIRADFTFREEMRKPNAELAAQISQCNAVSLHVRRGDYAYNQKTNSIHGLCSLDYYRSAVSYMAERLRSPVFFIFSDDMPWVKNNLKIDFPCTYVEHNKAAESHNDMRLMSLCKHHIIANSSFSWWGAWLNAHLDKTVIAPRRWFANGGRTEDLIPDGWVSL